MASISSIGIGSGVLTSDLIEKLANAEKDPVEKRLKLREESVKAKLSDFGRIQNAVTDLRLAARTLGNPASIATRTASSSNSAVTVTASNSAALGQYAVQVTSLAQSHSIATNSFPDQDKTKLGTGSMAIKVGSVTKNISITNSNNTLQGIAKEINSSKIGVTASVINTGSGYQLVFSSEKTGTDNAIQISVTDTDGNHTDTSGLSQLAFNASASNLSEKVAAKNALFSVNGIEISRQSNSISDVIEGVNFELTAPTTSPSTIKITRDVDAVAQRVQDFVDKFNEMQKIINEVTQFNPDGQSGTLLGHSSVRTITAASRAIIGGVVKGMEGAGVRSLAEIGVASDPRTGILSFDQDKFKQKLASHEADVAGLFAERGQVTDAQVEFVRGGLNTKVGSYAVEVTRMATQGQFIAAGGLSGNTIIDSGNKSFRIKVDGIESDMINLTEKPAGYTNAEFVEEVRKQINSDAKLSGRGISVDVSLDADNKLVFTSGTYGSKSAVEFTYVAPGGTGGAQPATSGSFSGTVGLTDDTLIDADNSGYRIMVDGIESDSIQLAEGTYTNADLVAEFQAKLNADPNFLAAGVAVTVGLDANNQLTFTSSSSGSASSVAFTAVGANSAATLGIDAVAGTSGQDANPGTGSSAGVTATWGVSTGAGTAGVDVAGKINGKVATGVGQTLSAAEKDDAEGISVKIIGGTVGARGTVTYSEGVGDQFVKLINGFLGLDGTVTATTEGFNKQLAQISEERSKLNVRIESLTTRLAKQFTAADAMIARLKSTESFMKAQFAALNGTKNE